MDFDKNKLTRDYDLEPITRKNPPIYEDLYYLYIECNLTWEEIANIFHINRGIVGHYLGKFNIKKPRELHNQNINRKIFEKYGKQSYSQTNACKEKYKQTCLEKYGVDNPNKLKEVRDKIKQTCLEKYGVDSGAKSDIAKEKYKQTCLEKYGVDSVNKLDWKNKKFRDTCLKKYGTPSNSNAHINLENLEILNDKNKLKEYIENCKIKTIYYVAETLKVSHSCVLKRLHEYDLLSYVNSHTSSGEIELKNLFPDFKTTRKIITPLELDMYNEDLKLAIEFNGNYWHSDIFKNKNYHKNKSNLCKEQGIFLFHIFEYEWLDSRKKQVIISMLNNLLGKNERIFARNCFIKKIDYKTCYEFLQKNHLQGGDKSSIRLGLYYNNELYSVMTFCKPRFNKKYEYELSRFCNKQNYSIVGGASKLFNYFVKNYNPTSIISYSNVSKTRGLLYEKLNFKFIRQTSPNYVWFKNEEYLSRYQCQKHKLIKYSNLGNTETEIMQNLHYNRVYDCGNILWEWQSPILN